MPVPIRAVLVQDIRPEKKPVPGSAARPPVGCRGRPVTPDRQGVACTCQRPACYAHAVVGSIRPRPSRARMTAEPATGGRSAGNRGLAYHLVRAVEIRPDCRCSRRAPPQPGGRCRCKTAAGRSRIQDADRCRLHPAEIERACRRPAGVTARQNRGGRNAGPSRRRYGAAEQGRA